MSIPAPPPIPLPPVAVVTRGCAGLGLGVSIHRDVVVLRDYLRVCREEKLMGRGVWVVRFEFGLELVYDV
eukprot:1372480-Amorphochlora_amoeboformis.AAC.1